ncbi:HEPN domain-containing protein [Caenispirillum bisanense]|uniref:HEPN domain-containing protein n=1 Tax=Caenispirillum bisanense TaxID=414052 RepID=A0A286GXM8_9PROT|nr:HEPN domain-containing protein [Caenispirillum bisanense]
MTDIDKSFADLTIFIENYSLAQAAGGPEFIAPLRVIHKRLYHLMIWIQPLATAAGGAREGSDENLKFLYFAECVSDLCQAVLVGSQGIYKSAAIVLRSAVENAIKYILIRCGGTPNHTSVHELFSDTRARLNTSHRSIVPALDNLRAEYSVLCTYTHTADPTKMTLALHLNHYPFFEEGLWKKFGSTASRCCANIHIATSLLEKDAFRSLPYQHRDIVLSGLPRQLRRTLQ